MRQFGLALALFLRIMNIIAGLSSLLETTGLTLLGFALITLAVLLRKRFGTPQAASGAAQNQTLEN